MRHPDAGARERPTGSAGVSAAEKLACEWEARHDVAARGRWVDPAAALYRYLNARRVEEDLDHADASARRSQLAAARPARGRDEFAARHPLAASWLRWGEDPR
jgi:hypothetical protein